LQERLRRATPEDAAAVRLLVRAAYAKWLPVMGREPQPMTVDYDQAIRDHIVDLLFVDDDLVAIIELVLEPDCVLIENVAVRPDRAGRGHGRHLMAHAVEIARSTGRERLRLFTNSLMVENVGLYEGLGYVRDREEMTPDGRRLIHMTIAI
jgi:ribosomal protein S18 acetylase RimI-like enzyme